MSQATVLLLAAVLSAAGLPLAAQIRVDPNGVNVNSQGATTVFLTFGGLADQVPVEAFWCGELIPAAPDVGNRCDPATLFGQLPIRYDRARVAGGRLTDIMSIPPSVARRAYQAAEEGAVSSFFYVRRFQSLSGGPDEYVAVTCRMTGGGARTPLALTDVRLGFAIETPVLELRQGEPAPPFQAEIVYTGTGRLRGRWEVVLPGEEPPDSTDLLTEATLAPEARGTQRRFTELGRFNEFLPAGGRLTLAGPDASRLPTTVDGIYQVLLRVEVSDDKEGNSNLGNAGAGSGIVNAGAVAGFPLPVLRYVVGSGGSELAEAELAERISLLLPADGARADSATATAFSWRPAPRAAHYRLELRGPDGAEVFSAIVPGSRPDYLAPPWLAERVTATAGGASVASAASAAASRVRWRVIAIDREGRDLVASAWRTLSLGRGAP